MRWLNLSEYMQHTREQYSWWFSSRLPMQCRIATDLGASPFLQTMCPPVGPDALEMRSNSRLVMTFSSLP